MNKLVKKSDIIFTVIIAAAILLVWLFSLPREAGTQVVFRKDGEVMATLPRSKDTI